MNIHGQIAILIGADQIKIVNPTGGIWDYVGLVGTIILIGVPVLLYVAWNQIITKRNTAAAIAFGFILLTATMVLLHSCS